MMADWNDVRCQRVPMYGTDLVKTVSIKLPTVSYKTGAHCVAFVSTHYITLFHNWDFYSESDVSNYSNN